MAHGKLQMAPYDPKDATKAAKMGLDNIGVSYAEQFQQLKGCNDRIVLDTACPKPDMAANEQQPRAYRLPLAPYFMV